MSDFGTQVSADMKSPTEKTLTLQWQVSAGCFALDYY